ncbi:MAG TPA: hypothetical protein VKZ54_12090 [Membranihabitans sp.]|nr:hypothetical protein [Membranihabitans sp.]
MKKLESFEIVRLDLNETMKIRGNGFWSDYFWGKVLEYGIKLAFHDPEQYGRRMYETGSPGGHK